VEKLDRKIIRKMIIQEAKAIKRQKILHEQNIKIATWCANKEKLMLSEGYSRMEVNEGIMGDLLGLAGDTVLGAPGGFLDTVEQMVIEKLLKALFGDYDPDSFVGVVIANVLENIDITELSKYFGEGACDPIVEMLYKGISEAIIQKGLSKLFGDRSDSGMLVSTMRESFTNALNSTEFQTRIKQGIKDTVCSFNYSAILDSLKSGFGGALGGIKNMFSGETKPV
jgi:hypothetical protein